MTTQTTWYEATRNGPSLHKSGPVYGDVLLQNMLESLRALASVLQSTSVRAPRVLSAPRPTPALSVPSPAPVPGVPSCVVVAREGPNADNSSKRGFILLETGYTQD